MVMVATLGCQQPAGLPPAVTIMKTFIQVSEIWVPSKDRTMLEFHGGLYGPHAGFRAASEGLCFGFDEGLPGKAWAARHPIILKDLQDSYFRRARAAQQAGLTCGVALPIFAGDYLLAVLVFFCGGDDERVGVIELWHNDPAQSHDMALIEGHYGIAESFERVARNTSFRRGFGLPGGIWESAMPEILSELWHSKRFLRHDDARRVGLSKGLGLPSLYAPGQNYVMAFLSALGTPIARRFEIWTPDARGEALVLAAGDCDLDRDFAAAHATTRLSAGESPVGLAWATGLPGLSESIGDDGSPVGLSARKAGLDAMLAFPVLENGYCKAVVAMYF